MIRRIYFFSIGAFISIIFLSIGPENRLKDTFYAYIDYFNINKRVISHLINDDIQFSNISECQLNYYNIEKNHVLEVLNNGKVNFKISEKIKNPCQYYVVEKKIESDFFSVKFKFCDSINSVVVESFIVNSEDIQCIN
tara:strand:- start:1115 stop:1528 length:414 start_codon:yes stop_codon:yes gene_type:complete